MLISYVIGPTISSNHYTTEIIKQQLARNLPNLFGDLKEEIVLAFDDKIPPSEGISTPHTKFEILPDTYKSK